MIQGSNPYRLHCRQIFLPIEPPGKPLLIQVISNSVRKEDHTRAYTRGQGLSGIKVNLEANYHNQFSFFTPTTHLCLSHIIINIHYFISSFVQQTTFQEIFYLNNQSQVSLLFKYKLLIAPFSKGSHFADEIFDHSLHYYYSSSNAKSVWNILSK